MYKEIFRLKKMLEDKKISFSFKFLYDGYQIIYLKNGKRRCSIIEHWGSYGSSKDLLEIMGLLTEAEAEEDGVLGYLSADEVFRRIKEDWKK